MALLVRPFFLDRITEYPRRILILADPVMAALPSKPRSRSDGRERRLGGGSWEAVALFYRPASRGSP